MKFYLIEGMTRIVATTDVKGYSSEETWLGYLQIQPGKLLVHSELEKQLTELGYKDGDEIPSGLFIPSAVPKSMEDQFTES